MMPILITGIGGMVGSHMADYFFNNSIEVVGTYYKPTTDITEICYKSKLIECDIRYYSPLMQIISRYKPSKIFHLAAQSFPVVSWNRPLETMDININGTINLFEAIKEVKAMDNSYDPIVVVACSSAEYGSSLTPDNVPIKEELNLLPLHPYGVSKVAQDLLSYQYYKNDNIKSIRARIFNTTGPRKVNDAPSDFVKRAVQIEKLNKINTLKVGNIYTKRAITDVRDLVMALILLSEKGNYGDVYNISGSKVYEMKEIIDLIRDYMKIDFEIEVDEKLLRPTDEPIIIGDSSKLIRDTGWRQKYTLEMTIKDMVDYWRQKYNNES